MKLDDLDSAERLALMKFVCSFAWADLKVVPQERAFVARMVDRLGLGAAETARVKSWLESPPPPDAVDPMDIPRRHRVIFLEAVRGVIRVDGVIAEEEREQFEVLSELLDS